MLENTMSFKKFVCSFLLFGGIFFLSSHTSFAAAPTGTSAVLQNTTSSTMDIVVTGTNFSTFVSSGTTTANGTDRAKITWRTLNPNTAVINNATTMTLTFTNAYGTDINGNSLTIAADAVQDGSSVHNALITIASGSITDNAVPTVFTLLHYYADANRDGTVDGLYLSFTEPVTCSFESGDWAITTAGTINVTAITGCSSYTSTTVLLAVTASSGITGGGTHPQVSYTNQGTLASVKDSANNAFASTSGITPGDAASPQIKSFTYLDNDADGKIDRITLTYTETVAAGSVLRAADLAFSNVGGFTGAAFGSDTTDLITGSVTQTTITIGTEATAVDTFNSSGSIAINSQGNFSLTEGFNTNNTLRTQSQANYIDGAAPVYVSSQTIDNNQNGTIDHVRVVYSEPISDASVALSDYAAGFSGVGAGALVESFGTGTPGSGVFTDAGNDEVIYVGVTSGTDVIAPNKTDYTLHIAQVGSIADAVGNALASFSEKTSTDGAAPALYTSTVIDTYTTDTTPTVFFSIIEDGTLSYTGGCTMPLGAVAAGAFLQAFEVLAEGTYTCAILGTDALGNVSAPLTFNTFTVDLSAPIISAAAVNSSGALVTVSWTTQEAASSLVAYGPTTAYGFSTAETDTAPRVTTHSVTVSNLSFCQNYYFQPRSVDAAGNETLGTSIEVRNLGSCGGGLSLEAMQDPITPAGGFVLKVNGGAGVTNTPVVALQLLAGANVTSMVVSNKADLGASGQQVYTPTLPWSLCWSASQIKEPATCPAGTYTVYARFYTAWGRGSKIVSTTVVYDPKASATRTVVKNNQLLLDKSTIYLVMGTNKYGFASLSAFTGLGYSLKNLQKGSSTAYTLAGIFNSAQDAHPVGSWVVSKGTIYFVSVVGLIPVPTWALFLSNGGAASYVVPANAADLNRPVLPLMSSSDSRIVL